MASSDGVAVAVHHLAGHHLAGPDLAGPDPEAGESDSAVLIAHATGFHGRSYAPLATNLGDAHDVWALDFRGHGATPAPAGWVPDWNRYGDDVTAAALWLDARGPGSRGSLVGFGHSMGGAALLMAAHRHRDLFRAFVLYEPIVFPPPENPEQMQSSPLVIGARRRRRRFDSYEAAVANFASKPPMSAFDPAALEAYVRGGLTPVDPDDESGPVRLCCDPELEAATFANSHRHRVWDLLGEIDVPTVVVAGLAGLGDLTDPTDATSSPAHLAEPIADRLPRGLFLPQARLDHFGPFTDPRTVAGIVREMVRSL